MSTHSSSARVRVADDKLPSPVGLPAEKFDGFGGKIDCLSRIIDGRSLEVGIENRQIMEDNRPEHAGGHSSARLNKPADHFADLIAADKDFAGLRHEARPGFGTRT